jgi:hypothetical protein
VEKLKAISSEKNSIIPDAEEARKISKTMSKRRKEMKRAHDFLASEIHCKINKDNQILLSKLVAITNGQGVTVPKSELSLPPL